MVRIGAGDVWGFCPRSLLFFSSAIQSWVVIYISLQEQAQAHILYALLISRWIRKEGAVHKDALQYKASKSVIWRGNDTLVVKQNTVFTGKEHTLLGKYLADDQP